jgi:hypothetical protein
MPLYCFTNTNIAPVVGSVNENEVLLVSVPDPLPDPVRVTVTRLPPKTPTLQRPIEASRDGTIEGEDEARPKALQGSRRERTPCRTAGTDVAFR